MQTTTISNNGRITIPATIRRKYGWNDGSTGVIAPFPGGFVFSLSEMTAKKNARSNGLRVPPLEWSAPEPTRLGAFRVPAKDWRELANE